MAAEQKAGQESAGTIVGQLGQVFRGAGERTIGAMCFWSLSGVDVSRDEFRAAFEAIGMAAAVPRDPRHDTSLTTAVKAVQIGKRDVVVRRVAKGWGIVLEKTETETAGARLKLTHALTVHADPDPTTIRLAREKDPANRLAPELVWKFSGTPDQIERARLLASEITQEYLKTRARIGTSDLSAVLVNTMHGTTKDSLLAAVSLRQSSGGLYFVHASKVQAARDLADTVHRIAPKCALSVLTITGNADNLAAAAQAAKNGFVTQLNELKAEVAQFRSETDLGKRTERNVTVRAAHYTALASRVQLFRDVLGDIADELNFEITAAKAEVERLLDAP
jgi:hypothetical protein